jgi:putative transposase
MKNRSITVQGTEVGIISRHERARPCRAPLRFGYTDAHRCEDGPNGMNTDLTDAEWPLVADLFERQGGRGAPAWAATPSRRPPSLTRRAPAASRRAA